MLYGFPGFKKDAYFAIPISNKYKKYLKFCFEDIHYNFNVMPFGISTAPYVFTKLLKPIGHYLRSRAVTGINYLDDFIIIGETRAECMQNVKKVLSLLIALGFNINCKKCCLIPTTRCKYLEFIFASTELSLFLFLQRKLKILSNKITPFFKIKILENSKVGRINWSTYCNCVQ